MNLPDDLRAELRELCRTIYENPELGFKEFNAVEWVIHFTNTSQQNTPQIKQVKALDYTMQAQSEKPYQLLSCKGTNASRAMLLMARTISSLVRAPPFSS